MSILRKDYEISVWDDEWNGEKFVEKRLGIIGSSSMSYEGRAIEPDFSRNVNGVKKLSFKMYKYFIDPITGEKTLNPFVDWLISERKVKLYYEDKWYDFIVKNIVEDSKNYLYTYQLEDALVQELSKNGFGVTLDMKLNNNMGTANGLAAEVLKETDWRVASDSEAFVERVDETLVYVSIDADAYKGRIKHIIDQDENNRNIGVTLEDVDLTGTITALAFYSSCTGKPHRFQFIYLEALANSLIPQLSVYKDDNRTIAEKNCQYYIDFDSESDYITKDDNFYLPAGISTTTKMEEANSSATKLSCKYRGERYGFAQQAEYIPVLDRYCSKYYCPADEIVWEGFLGTDVVQNGKNYELTITQGAGGLKCIGDKFIAGQTYSLKYTIEQVGGVGPMSYIGGHAMSEIYEQISFTIDGVPQKEKYADGAEIGQGKHLVEFVFKFNEFEEGDTSLYIQPNRLHYDGVEYNFNVVISELSVTKLYYGYLNADYKSPALTTNLISGSALDSTHGWTGTRYYSKPDVETEEVEAEEVEKATVESVFGYFKDNEFVDSIEKIKNGSFDPDEGYESYLKIYFPEGASNARTTNSCVINSCVYDNRTLIGNISRSDQWALKYDVFNKDQNKLTFKLQECKYDPTNDYYSEVGGAGLIFEEFKFDEESKHYIAAMNDNSAECSEKDFKKNTQARLVITAEAPGDYYIKSISLFKASYVNGELITLEEQAEDIENRTVEKTYYYFSPAALDDVTEASELKPDYTSKTLDYSTYKPVYNTGAEKVRSVTAKESNYFNILQSIAETFEAWLLLEVERDELGGIINKSVKFKNYIGKDNYAGFHYGVNLQGIQRTYESKNIVTKLMVKSNSNEYAPNGFCTIQRANANPTGESYIYDFQYYFNRGLMNARDYLETIYIWKDSAVGPDIDGTSGLNLQGYYPRIKALNEQIEEKNEILINTAKDIVQYKAELEVATAGVDAASSGLEQVREDFKALTKIDFPTETTPLSEELGKRLDVQKLLKEYATYYSEYTNHSTKKGKAKDNLDAVQKVYDAIKSEVNALKECKIALNQLFFKQYSRFIQEGTWIDEEYVDDELYYADAQSVLYNSCYPQVAYQINVLELSKLPGYELFKFELGDKTYAEDPEFFGKGIKEEVIITELNENLDDPSKNTVKVQNFKNQFQDLFQKITATVQQAQYRTGSYERAVALAEANNERKNQFLSDALDTASARLTTAGQQSVTWGADGITVQDVDSPSDMIRMVGGAILLSKQDKNGEQKWVTGVTSDGISASLVTAGVINAGEIEIMDYDQPLFRWDSHGISAFSADAKSTEGLDYITNFNSKKFVRFDKNGIYGIDDEVGIDGLGGWYPGSTGNTPEKDIDQNATFALTWEGLKVTGRDKGTARLGKQSDYIMLVKDADEQGTFGITSEGKIETTGIRIVSGTIGGQPIASTKDVEDMGTSTGGYAQGLVETLKKELQPQIDGTITSWFDIGYPMPNIKDPEGNITISRSPADEWIKKDEGEEKAFEQIKHEGDLYYDRDTGFCYRWIYDDGSKKHCWILIKDTEVTKALKDAAEAQATADNKMHTFTEQPVPPYQEGDIWVNATYEQLYNNDLLRCCQERKDGEHFSISDWTLSSKYTDDSALDDFKNGEYADKIKEIYNQVDKKSDIYYEPEDPAEYSGETVWGDNRVGDLWRCTTSLDNYQTQKSTSNNTYVNRKKNSEWVWRKFSTNEYGWHEMEIPDNIFDAYDGKCSLYLEKPKTYKARDLWILEKQGKDSKADKYDSDYPPYEIGSLLVAKSNSPYNKSHWVEEVKYTDELNQFKNAYNQFTIDINKQLDKKAETWYTESDPSVNWKDNETKEKHIGDLWHFNSDSDANINGVLRKAHSEWIWQKNQNGTYSWLEMKVPDEVFDKIDNKSNIFTSIPTSGQINDGDILIPSTTSGSYIKGKVYRYNSTNETWSEIEYTDNTALNNFITNDYNNFVSNIKTQVDSKASTWYQSEDPSENWKDSDTKEKHSGDLWHDTTNNKEYIWYLKDGTYQWVEMAVPDEVFDTIDGIASIYTSIPSKPNVGDLYIPDANNGDYKIGKVYKYNGSQWTEINYTDDTTVNNLEIGGRNLLVGITKRENWSGYNDFNNGELTKISSLSTESYLNFSGKPTLEKGKQYTLSFEAKGTSNLSSTEVFFLQEDWTSTGIYTYGTGGITLTTDYKKYSFTFYPNADPRARDPKNCEIRFDHNGSTNGANATLWIKNVKLEKGGKATDWTIAPEDTEEILEELRGKAQKAIEDAASGFTLANSAVKAVDEAKATANAAQDYAKSSVAALDKAVAEYLGLGGTVLVGDKYVVSPYIGAGYLNVTSTDETIKVIIDPNNKTNQTKATPFQVWKNSEMVMGLDDEGNAYLKGNINAGGGNIAGWTITENSINKSIVLGSSTYTTELCAAGNLGGDVLSVWTKSNGISSYKFYLRSDGSLYCGNANIQGGKIANWDISSNSIRKGKLGENESFHMYANEYGAAGSIAGHEVITANSTTPGWLLGIGQYFGVTSDGKLYCTSGRIGKWDISENSLTNYSGEPYTSGGNTFYPDSFCMQTRYDNSIVNALAIGACSPNTWSSAAFRVTVDGKLFTIDGKIGELDINAGGLSGNGYSISPKGLSFESIDSEIKFKSLSIKNLQTSSKIEATGDLELTGKTASLVLTDGGTSEKYTLWVVVDCIALATFEADFNIWLEWRDKNGNAVEAPEAFSGSIYWWRDRDGTQKESGTIPMSIALGSKQGDKNFKAFLVGANGTDNRLYFNTTNYKPTGYVNARMGTGQSESVYTAETTASGGASQYFSITGNILPSGNNQYILGKDGKRWKEIWCTQSSLNSTSDRNDKTEIDSFSQKYETFFDELKPVTYKFIVNDSNRYHSGFISQDVEEALGRAGLTSLEFAGFIKFKKENQQMGYGLRYGEFIALNTWQIQKLKPRVSALEQTILNYETRISNLENELQNLKNS